MLFRSFTYKLQFTQIPVHLPCSEYEKQTKLNRFQGAAAISSNDYFDRDGAGSSSSMGQGGGGGDDMDLSAADLVNRLSFQVGQPSLEVVAALTPPTAGFADPASHHVALLSLCGACTSHPSLHTPLHVCPLPPHPSFHTPLYVCPPLHLPGQAGPQLDEAAGGVSGPDADGHGEQVHE